MKHARLLAALLLTGGGLAAQDLVSLERRGGITRDFFNLGAAAAGFDGITAEYGFDYYVVAYTMDNLAGERDTVSGLLSVPTPNGGLVFPRLVSQHGTTQTSADVPSATDIDFADLANSPIDVSVVYATQGYVTFAPDFLNMGLDGDGFHPYVNAETEALAAVRMIQALEADSLYRSLVHTSDQLFVTGYSQGGHASMALHELLVEDAALAEAFDVTAAAHMSGPYSVSEVMLDEVILRDSTYLFVGFVPYTLLALQAAYPELERDLAALFRPAVVPLVERFRDEWQAGTYPLNAFTEELARAIGRLDPATGDTIVYPYEMFTAAFEAELRDSADGPWREALRRNDTYDFANPTPTRLYYCVGDDLVTYRNAVAAADSLAGLGAAATEAVRLDTDAEPLGHGPCAEPAIRASIAFFDTLADFAIVDATRDPLPGRVDWVHAGQTLRVDTEGDAADAYALHIVDALGRELLRRPGYRPGEVADLAALPRGFAVARLTDARGRSAARALVLR